MSSEQDVLPGHTLSAFGPEEYAVAQREFSAEHLQATAAAAETMPKAAADKLLELALWDIRTGAFNYLSPGYEAKCMSIESLPLLLWLSLRVSKPDITREAAGALVTRENFKAVHFKLMDLAGVTLAAAK